ncbi:MAG TPA: site-specific integrase [Vicinamibacterales bacterium]|nr:site-specific integrase [Vicinamibacterales bacterium]
MSVRVRATTSGAWIVDVMYRRSDGRRARERRRVRVATKSAAQRWGEQRERHLMLHGPTPPKQKEVPTLEQFAPRFVDGHLRANRRKPSAVASVESILRWHLIPTLGTRGLDTIRIEQVQQLKLKLADRSPATTNNVLIVLGSVLKRAVEWGLLDRLPCTITMLPVHRTERAFYTFEEYDRLVEVARRRGDQAYLMVLLAGDAGLRLGEIVALEWRDVDLSARRLTAQRSEWLGGQVTAPKGGRLRRLPLTQRLTAALKQARRVGSSRVLCLPDGSPITRDRVIKAIRSAQRVAGLVEGGVHILRHSFLSHLAMRGAPARSIQDLAGHADLATTQRYLHLSPAATEDAIRLLERDTRGNQRGTAISGLGI